MFCTDCGLEIEIFADDRCECTNYDGPEDDISIRKFFAHPY